MPEIAPLWWRWLFLSAGVMVLDQITKALILATFARGETLALLPVFSLVLTFNPGAAFSFLAQATGWQRYFFLALALIAAVVLTLLLRRGGSRWSNLGLALIIGGALGNAIDRALLGEVVDFLLVHYRGWYFPAFNVADSAITLGAAALILDSFLHHGNRATVPGTSENKGAP
jgi:signal peptidase II